MNKQGCIQCDPQLSTLSESLFSATINSYGIEHSMLFRKTFAWAMGSPPTLSSGKSPHTISPETGFPQTVLVLRTHWHDCSSYGWELEEFGIVLDCSAFVNLHHDFLGRMYIHVIIAYGSLIYIS